MVLTSERSSGDNRGVFIGLVDSDHRPVYFNPATTPLSLVIVGEPGYGKRADHR